MVKFIITVSDGYIRERADVSNISETQEKNVMKSIMDIMSFSCIEADIKEKGDVEYNIDSKDFNDSKKLEMFNAMLSMLAALSCLTKDKDKDVAK